MERDLCSLTQDSSGEAHDVGYKKKCYDRKNAMKLDPYVPPCNTYRVFFIFKNEQILTIIF